MLGILLSGRLFKTAERRLLAAALAAVMAVQLLPTGVYALGRQSMFARISEAVSSSGVREDSGEEGSLPDNSQPEEIPQSEDDSDNGEVKEAEADEDNDGSEDSEPGYVSPIDFEEYQKKNKDVYAWIKIPGTKVDYPIVQNQANDEYYLTNSWEKKMDKGGAIFTEHAYNGTDFSDPVTILYGHRMNDDSMFGQLQKLYSSASGLKNYSEIIIYLPDEELHYTVFAALPYGDEHILYNYDFTRLADYESFYSTVFSASGLGVSLSSKDFEKGGNDVIILSTCYKGNPNKRYLVLAQRD